MANVTVSQLNAITKAIEMKTYHNFLFLIS